MIKLPEPIELSSPQDERSVYGYNEAQLKQFGRDVLEQAAQACEATMTDCHDSNVTRHECAALIRKMKEML